MKQKAILALSFLALGLGGTVLVLSLPSCSRRPTWDSFEWRGERDGPLKAPPAMSGEKSVIKFSNNFIEFQTQEINGVPIEGSFYKTLIGSKGQLRWAKAQFLAKENLPSIKAVQKELQRQQLIGERLLEFENSLNCKLTGLLRPELRWKRSWKLVFKRLCEAPTGESFELVMNSRGKLISHDLIGSRLVAPLLETTATVFPLGPKLSTLKVVHLSVAGTPNFLLTPAVEVVSDSGLKFSDLQQLLKITPTDGRFDMLQAYFFSSRALEWVAQHLKYHMEGLRIRTQVGFPEKRNVAFYYGKEVRIGSGDDITFANMAWDPSIVIHETMHAVIDSLTRLPLGKGDGGSLHEGLADILTAIQLNSPRMGEQASKTAPFQRTLENQMKFTEKTGALYHDSLIFSGMLWEIKQKIDEKVAEEITIHLLERLAPNSTFTDVKTHLADWLSIRTLDERTVQVKEILRHREWL